MFLKETGLISVGIRYLYEYYFTFALLDHLLMFIYSSQQKCLCQQILIKFQFQQKELCLVWILLFTLVKLMDFKTRKNNLARKVLTQFCLWFVCRRTSFVCLLTKNIIKIFFFWCKWKSFIFLYFQQQFLYIQSFHPYERKEMTEH